MSSEIGENNPQGCGGNEGQERISSAEAAEDAPSRPLEPSPVSLDLQPLPYNDLSDQEKEAFHRFIWTVPQLFRRNVEARPLGLQEEQQQPPSLSFLKSLVKEYPKITRVKKATSKLSFLLEGVAFLYRGQTGTTAESLTDLLKVLIQSNPSACFWEPGPSHSIICIECIVTQAPLILLWLAKKLPCVLVKTYAMLQENGNADRKGLSASFAILEHYFQQKVSTEQALEYFENYPQGLADSFIYIGQDIPVILFIVWKTVYFGFRDEHLKVLKFVASKRPDLLCTGQLSVVLTALCYANKVVGGNDTMKDKSYSLIKILVRACPASILTEGRIYCASLFNAETIQAQTPFDVIQQSNSVLAVLANNISDDLKPFFALTKEC